MKSHPAHPSCKSIVHVPGDADLVLSKIGFGSLVAFEILRAITKYFWAAGEMVVALAGHATSVGGRVLVTKGS